MLDCLLSRSQRLIRLETVQFYVGNDVRSSWCHQVSLSITGYQLVSASVSECQQESATVNECKRVSQECHKSVT